jgi:hypothetical protein
MCQHCGRQLDTCTPCCDVNKEKGNGLSSFDKSMPTVSLAAFEQVKRSLDCVKFFLERLSIDSYAHKIRTSCEYLQWEVDIDAESKITLINRYRAELIDEITKHETKCLSEESIAIRKLAEFSQQFKAYSCMHDDLTSKLADKDCVDFGDLLKQANQIRTCLDDMSIELDRVMFADTRLYYHSHEIGHLGLLNSIPTFKPNSSLISTIGKRVVKYKVQNHFDQTSTVHVGPGDLIAVSVSSSVEMLNGLRCESMRLFLFNKNGKLLKSKDHAWFMDCIGILNDTIYLGHIGKSTIRLNLFDFELNFKQEIVKYTKHITRYKSIQFNDQEIILTVLISQSPEYISHIFIFNDRLEQTDLIKLNVAFVQIKVKPSLLFLLKDSGHVEVMCRTRLLNLHTIEMGSTVDMQFDVYQESRLVVADRGNKMIRTYDLNGNRMEEICAYFMSSLSVLQVTSSGDVCVDDKTAGILYLN